MHQSNNTHQNIDNSRQFYPHNQYMQPPAALPQFQPPSSVNPYMYPQNYYWDSYWNGYYYAQTTAAAMMYTANTNDLNQQQKLQNHANQNQNGTMQPQAVQFGMPNMYSYPGYYHPPPPPHLVPQPAVSPYQQFYQQQLSYPSQLESSIQRSDTIASFLKADMMNGAGAETTNSTSSLSSAFYLNTSKPNDLKQIETSITKIPREKLLFYKPHIRASFGINCLIQIRANDPCDGQPSLVDIHNVHDLIEDYLNTNDNDYRLVREFPGPLVKDKTPKALIMQYCQKQIKECTSRTISSSIAGTDIQSYQLLWEYLCLLIRQNGYFDLKTDISTLLLGENYNWTTTTSTTTEHHNSNGHDGHKEEHDGQEQENELVETFSSKLKLIKNGDQHGSGSGGANGVGRVDTADVSNGVLSKLKEYLSNGNRLNAIDWLCKHNEWSHAFFIASTMSSTSQLPTTATSSTSTSSSSANNNNNNSMVNKIKLKFINSIPHQDPIYTLYQLYMGRVPTLSTINWNEWRLHLSLILSNLDVDTLTASGTTSSIGTSTNMSTNESLIRNSIKKFADTLASNCRFMAAHFCYLLINTQFGDYKKKSSKIVLIGSSHLEDFDLFCQLRSIHATEIYEFITDTPLESFLYYKLLYAQSLCQYGFLNEAYKYVEIASKHLSLDTYPFLISIAYRLATYLKTQTSDFETCVKSGLTYEEPKWLGDLESSYREYQQKYFKPKLPQPQQINYKPELYGYYEISNNNNYNNDSCFETESSIFTTESIPPTQQTHQSRNLLKMSTCSDALYNSNSSHQMFRYDSARFPIIKPQDYNNNIKK